MPINPPLTSSKLCSDKINSTPPRCQNPTMLIYKDSIYVFGGFTDEKFAQTKAFFKFNIYTKKWVQITASGAPQCGGHSAVLYDGQMFVFGGYGNRFIDDVHCFDFQKNSWKLLQVHGNKPPKRHRHSAVVVGDKMLIMGGNDGQNYFDDTYELNLQTMVWNKVMTINQPKRSSRSAVLVGKLVYLFGGCDYLNTYRDLHIYDTQTHVWTSCMGTGDIPLERYGHSAVVFENCMYIFGGSNTRRERYGDCYSFCLDTKKWTRLVLDGIVPSPRGEHVVSLYDDTMYVFGGLGKNGLLSDLYEIRFPRKFDISRLESLIESDKMVDLKVKIGNDTFNVHRCILGQTKELKNIIPDDPLNGKPFQIKLSNIKPNVFRKILEYLYSGTINLNTAYADIYVELIISAHLYGLEELEMLCKMNFDKVISPKTFPTVITSAYEHQHDELKQMCFDYFHLKKKQISENQDLLLLDKSVLSALLFSELSNKKEETSTDFNKYKRLKDHIANLYTTKDYSDVILLTKEKKKFRAHKAILYSFCDFFYAMFNNSQFEENNMDEIDLSVDSDILEIALQFIYTQRVTLPDDCETLTRLIIFADKILLNDLKDICANHLTKMVTPRNVVQLLQLCNETPNIGGLLKDTCINLIKSSSKNDLVEIILEQAKKISELREELRSKDAILEQAQIVDCVNSAPFKI